MGRKGIVIVGGDPPSPSVRAVLPRDPELVIAADSGFDYAVDLGLRVDVLVGDLDSISADGLSLAEATAGLTIERHRPDKDFTDTELAIALALEGGVDHLIGVAGGGDRLDHQLGTIAAFASAAANGVRVELWWRSDHLEFLYGPMSWSLTDVPVETIVSLVPFGGPVVGVTTRGLRYPLSEAILRPTSALGVSNVVDGAASVDLVSGTLLLITPGALS
jgi:thiamine pyrophosphokinase